MKKILWILLLMILLLCVFFITFFNKKMFKILKKGNNMSSQEIVDYVLNISSYNANIEVVVNSNKRTNRYILNQEYISPNTNKQEVLEPENIAGIKIIKDENGLTIENSRLNLSNIYENYEYLSDNCLDLSSFINDYNNSNKSYFEEKENYVIMKSENVNGNNYTKNKALYVDKGSLKPKKMEIKDNNQKTTVNILYNEVEIIEQNQ